MNIEAFKRQSVLGWGAAIFLIGFALFSASVITVPAIQWQITSPELRSSLGQNPLPVGWTWAQVILIDLSIFLLIGYLSLQPIIQVLTKFTDNGIEQPTLFQNKVIDWQDVQEIRNITTANIEISGSKTKIYLNPVLFVDHHALINELRLRVPALVFPSDEQIAREVNKHKRNDAGRTAIGMLFFGICIFVFGKDIVSYLLGLLMVGYGMFEFRKWLKLGHNP